MNKKDITIILITLEFGFMLGFIIKPSKTVLEVPSDETLENYLEAENVKLKGEISHRDSLIKTLSNEVTKDSIIIYNATDAELDSIRTAVFR